MVEVFEPDLLIMLGIAAVGFFNAAYNVAVGPTGGAMVAGFSSLLPPALALMLQAIGNIIGGFTRTITFFKKIERRPFLIIMAGMALGFALAMPIFRYVPEYILQLCLGILIVLMTWLPKRKTETGAQQGMGLFVATAGGSALSVFFATGMMVVGSYYARYFPERDRYLAHTNIWSLIQNLIKIIWFSTWLKVDLHVMALLGALVFISMMAGHYTGLKIAGRVPEERLRQALKITITLFAMVLLYKGTVTVWSAH